MAEKSKQGGNVLPFKPRTERAVQQSTAVENLRVILPIYDHLIVLLRETYDEGIDAYTDELVVSVVRCREELARGMNDQIAQAMLQEMREELRRFPRTLRSLLPGIGPRLGESIEWKLGIQFSRL